MSVDPAEYRTPDGLLLDGVEPDREADGKVKGVIPGGTSVTRRVSATSIVDTAAAQLYKSFQKKKKVAAIFSDGFSPLKEMMRLYAEECQKSLLNRDSALQLKILRSMMPYLYPQLRSIDHEITGEMPTLTLQFSEVTPGDDDGKGGIIVTNAPKI